MTNREKYKQAFSALHASREFSLEVETMKHTVRHHRLKTAVVLAAACILLVGTATATYTADVGGIQRTVQLWIHGDQTTATIQIADDGSYCLEYPDENGEIQEQFGGGVAFNPDGSERPLTEKEILEELSMPDVEYQENGSVWVYWCGQSIDINFSRPTTVPVYLKITNLQTNSNFPYNGNEHRRFQLYVRKYSCHE